MRFTVSGGNCRNPQIGFAALGLTVSLLVAPAVHAQNATYNNKTAFDSAVGATTLVTFESPVAANGQGTYFGGYVNNDATNGQATFYSFGTSNALIVANSYKSGIGDVQSTPGQQTSLSMAYEDGSLYNSDPSKNPNLTTNPGVVFTETQHAFGTLYGGVKGFSANLPWEADFYSGGTLVGTVDFTDSYNPNSPAFLGFTSMTGFDRIIFEGLTSDPGQAGYLQLDNVQYTSAVPEPGMLVTGLSMAGMTGLGLLRGRRRGARRQA